MYYPDPFHLFDPRLDYSSTTTNLSESSPYDPSSLSSSHVPSKHPALAVLLCTFAVATVWGNTLVILAVICRPNLHTPTGYLVLSLAVADLIVGLGVMPLNVVFEMYDQIWMFNLAMCDLWHSLDVLASTSSIWNLCIIAVDRCLAVTDPLNYPELISVRRVSASIAVVWIGSALISFPAVAWWRAASPELYVRSDRCLFTDDTGYLIFSSLLSFYLPLLIIVGAYGRVYAIAARHQRSLVVGRQPLPCNPSIYIRVHRGGGATQTFRNPSMGGPSPLTVSLSNATTTTTSSCAADPSSSVQTPNTPIKTAASSLISSHTQSPQSWPNNIDTYAQKQSSSSAPLPPHVGTALKKHSRHNYGSYQNLAPLIVTNNNNNNIHINSFGYASSDNSSMSTATTVATATTTPANSSTRTSRSDSAFSYYSRRSRVSLGSTVDSSLTESKRRRKPRPSLLIRLFAKESKAAKTLGIVVGAFIACWLPFFIVNVLSGACGDACQFGTSGDGFRLTFTVVTWLGHCNSFLNPIIYTCFNREFRDAFAYVLFCGRWTRRGRAYARRRQLHRQLTAVSRGAGGAASIIGGYGGHNGGGGGGQSMGGGMCGAKQGIAKALEGGLRVIVPQATNAEAVVVVTTVDDAPLTEEKEDEMMEEEEEDGPTNTMQDQSSDQDDRTL